MANLGYPPLFTHRLIQQLATHQWIFTTIHRSDEGHKISGYFYTNDFEVVINFCAAMKPLSVTCSLHPSIEDAQKFASEINPTFVPIDPKTYKLEMQ